MSQKKPRRLRFRGRNLTPDQLAVAQEYTWADKNRHRLMNEAGNCRDDGSAALFEELFDLSGDDLIEWNRRNQLT
jgi:hypothetical protein